MLPMQWGFLGTLSPHSTICTAISCSFHIVHHTRSAIDAIFVDITCPCVSFNHSPSISILVILYVPEKHSNIKRGRQFQLSLLFSHYIPCYLNTVGSLCAKQNVNKNVNFSGLVQELNEITEYIIKYPKCYKISKKGEGFSYIQLNFKI